MTNEEVAIGIGKMTLPPNWRWFGFTRWELEDGSPYVDVWVRPPMGRPRLVILREGDTAFPSQGQVCIDRLGREWKRWQKGKIEKCEFDDQYLSLPKRNERPFAGGTTPLNGPASLLPNGNKTSTTTIVASWLVPLLQGCL